MGRVAGCFPRRESRGTFREIGQGLLMESEDVNCWTPAGAIGHRGPHRLQDLLSRAVRDQERVLERTATWAVQVLDDGEGVPIAEETGDEKSSTDAVGAGPQYSGALGGVGVCQVAVHLTFATDRGHMVTGRAPLPTHPGTVPGTRNAVSWPALPRRCASPPSPNSPRPCSAWTLASGSDRWRAKPIA
ncbi:transposase [Streptomyces sp. NPDC058439]|uniref:transposase n=1 Tax=Streptomyces sp. NPDC058439 TaxID=3346500 RepID=UPI003655C7C0